jgi:hypothetical protein
MATAFTLSRDMSQPTAFVFLSLTLLRVAVFAGAGIILPGVCFAATDKHVVLFRELLKLIAFLDAVG